MNINKYLSSKKRNINEDKNLFWNKLNIKSNNYSRINPQKLL